LEYQRQPLAIFTRKEKPFLGRGGLVRTGTTFTGSGNHVVPQMKSCGASAKVSKVVVTYASSQDVWDRGGIAGPRYLNLGAKRR